MGFWPVPSSYEKTVYSSGERAFGAPREYKHGSGRHAGIDIYSPAGSKVVAIESGKVVHVSEFTGFPWSPQWRRTYYVMIEHEGGLVAVYGELRKPRLRKGQFVKAGQVIGYITRVLKRNGQKYGSSMLHFELHKKGSRVATDWYGKKPGHLIDPTKYLKSLI